jgi:enoyl-CoA hydratase
LTPKGGALDGARALAAEISANSPFALAMTKRVVTEAAGWPVSETWSRQREMLEQVITSNDAREGALAFAEKRSPRWGGT